MTIEQMREFVLLAEERNYQVAADRLYSTQATLSRHIMAMEEELGFPLFNRSTKRIELTGRGGRFLAYARRAVHLQDTYSAELSLAVRADSETLRIGQSPIVTLYRVSSLLTAFIAANRQWHVQISSEQPDALLQSIRSGTLDIAFMQDDPFEPESGIDRVCVDTDSLIAVLPPFHPFAKEKSIALSQLSGERFVIGEKDVPPGSVFIKACRRAGFEPQIAYADLVGSALYDWVAGGEFAALDWKKTSQLHRNSGTAIVEIHPPVTVAVSAVYLERKLSPAGRELLRFLQAHGLPTENGGRKNEV